MSPAPSSAARHSVRSASWSRESLSCATLGSGPGTVSVSDRNSTLQLRDSLSLLRSPLQPSTSKPMRRPRNSAKVGHAQVLRCEIEFPGATGHSAGVPYTVTPLIRTALNGRDRRREQQEQARLTPLDG